jgi:Chaperone of endosialidase
MPKLTVPLLLVPLLSAVAQPAEQNTTSLVFITVVPCRLVDTRNASFPYPFGQPSFAARETRTIAVPTNTVCGIPGTAQAYSLNFTVVPLGALGYLSAWPTPNRPVNEVSILNSWSGLVIANGAVVPAGVDGSIDVFVSDPTDVIIDINGYYIPPSAAPLTGTAAAPALTFGATDAGFFSAAPGSIGIAAGGQPQVTVTATGLGVGTTAPAERLHLADGNFLLEGGGETAIKIKRDFSYTGGPSGPSTNPIFQFGRITQAGDKDPEMRFLYSDDNYGEQSVFEFDRKGIVASVKPAPGSHFEGFLSGQQYPLFRLNSYPKMRLEMGGGGSADVDVALQRETANTLTVLAGGAEIARVDPAGLHVTGPVFATAYNTSSDRRLKEDIVTLTDVLARLDGIRGVSFQWNAEAQALGNPAGRRQIGVLAQDVLPAFPELVTTQNLGGETYQAVDYGKLSVVLLEAVKELKAETDALKLQVRDLETGSCSR